MICQIVFLCMRPQDMRFANGTQGRLFWWTPGNIDDKKTLPSSYPELLVRFAKEGSVKKSELFSDIDTLDVQARQEPLKIRGEPQLINLPLVPAYALTIHKTQVLGRGRSMRVVLDPGAKRDKPGDSTVVTPFAVLL